VIELRAVESDGDVAAYLDVRNRAEPLDPVTDASLRRNLERPNRLDLLALADGVPVATGFASRNPEDAESSYGFARVFVLPERRRRGIGTRLLEALSDHAAADGREGFLTEARAEDAGSLAFLAHRGYDVVRRIEQLALDLGRSTLTEPALPEGVELVPLVDPALEPRVYEAALEIEPDLPAVEQQVVPPFDDWRAFVFSSELVRNGSFAALAHGEVVGFAVLYARPYGAEHGLTGVRRSRRRQGIARALKLAQINAAREHGLDELRTTNESGNEAIRRLNESLGYVPLATWLTLRGPLIRPEQVG